MADWLEELSADFFHAEEAVKRIEDDIGEPIVPSINELRYFANHICRASTATEEERVHEESLRGRRHLARARYDAYEAGVYYLLDSIKNFKERHRDSGESLLQVIPNWAELLGAIQHLKETTKRTSKRIRGERPQEYDPDEPVSEKALADDMEFAAKTEEFYSKLRDYFLQFEQAEPEIVKLRENKLAHEQTLARRWTLGILIAGGGLLFAFLKYLPDIIEAWGKM